MAIQILINFKLENAQSSKKSTHKKNQSGNKNDLYLGKNDGEGILKMEKNLGNKSKHEPSMKLNITKT